MSDILRPNEDEIRGGGWTEARKKQVIDAIVRKYNLGDVRNDKERFARVPLELIQKIWPSPEDVSKAKVLDLGCGTYDSMDASGHQRDFEPWLCRVLKELGADTYGVDVGEEGPEPFKFMRANFLADPKGFFERYFARPHTFDAVFMQSVWDSPTAMQSIGGREYMDNDKMVELAKEMQGQIALQLKPGGVFCDCRLRSGDIENWQPQRM